jgi:hypothetical protein
LIFPFGRGRIAFYFSRNSSGSLAIFTAIRRAAGQSLAGRLIRHLQVGG